MKIYIEQIFILTVFESNEDAVSCNNKNYAYMNKISTNIQQNGSEILLNLKNTCDPVISEEFEAVCENVKKSHCIYNSN